MILTCREKNFATEVEKWRETLESWMQYKAIPLWLEKGVDWTGGGFYDRLDPHTLENVASYKRLRVTARQIYSFSKASQSGCAEAHSAVEHGVDFLLSRCAIPTGGFASYLDLSGHQQPGAIDLYDNAFVLFALAHAFRLLGDTALRDAAESLSAYLMRNLAHPYGGFEESLPPSLPRRQNPHMHLLEAALAWVELDGQGTVFSELANALADLFQKFFYRRESGLIAEFFSNDWSVVNMVAEPGHHFEWVWLLDRLRDLVGRDIPSEGIYEIALDKGINRKSGTLLGQFDARQTAVEEVRIWPHAEWVRAEATKPEGNIERAASQLFRFLDHPVPGMWFETYSSRGFVMEDVPASSLYHIVGAVAALQAVELKVRK